MITKEGFQKEMQEGGWNKENDYQLWKWAQPLNVAH